VQAFFFGSSFLGEISALLSSVTEVIIGSADANSKAIEGFSGAMFLSRPMYCLLSFSIYGERLIRKHCKEGYLLLLLFPFLHFKLYFLNAGYHLLNWLGRLLRDCFLRRLSLYKYFKIKTNLPGYVEYVV
jgi:hypothetical protein